MTQQSLGPLADPHCFTQPLTIDGYDTDRLMVMLNTMILIRKAEETIADMDAAGDVRCPAHLAIGQEGLSAAIADYLTPADRAFGCHRSHGHYLAMGGSLDALMAEVLGKETGCSKGMGGSMHLYAGDVGFMGSVPIVAGTVPLAMGAGWAAKMDGSDAIGVAFFGDGACEEGVVHECLNMAATHDIPVLFVVENNLFSSHMDMHLRQPDDRVARFADAHHVAAETVDGNDVTAVCQAMDRLTKIMRQDRKPAFLEGVTYRWRGHVGPDENIDVGLRRSASEIAAWKKRDPIARLVDALKARGDLDDFTLERMHKDIDERIKTATNLAYEAPYPQNEQLWDSVYA